MSYDLSLFFWPKVLVATLILSLTLGCSSESRELTVPSARLGGEPTEGLGWLSRISIDSLLRWQVRSGERSGFVAMFARDGQQVYANAWGWEDIETQRPMRLDSRMRFASMTKPVTAVAAMILVEEGRLDLNDPVASYIPAYANVQVASSHTRNAAGGFDMVAAQPQPLVRHLLMFASGIGPGRDTSSDLMDYWQTNTLRSAPTGSLGERIDQIAAHPLFEQPGIRWRYGWSADVLARVVEVASGESFDRFVHRRIFAPLGMSATRFRYEEPDLALLATVYTQDEQGDLVKVEPDSDSNFPQGGSGLVSNAGDYLRFALMLWNGGEYQGVRILQQQTIANMTRLHLPGGVLAGENIEGIGWGLGVAVTADADQTPFGDRNGDFWWSGYFGTTFIVSPSTGLVGVVLSQNEPGPHSGIPYAVYVAQSLAYGWL